MAAIKVIGWEGVESFEISQNMAQAIGNEPCFAIWPENGYFCCEVRNNKQMVASSSFSAEEFPENLPGQDRPRFIFLWLFPSSSSFLPS